MIAKTTNLLLAGCLGALLAVAGAAGPSAAFDVASAPPPPQSGAGVVFQFSDQTWEVGFAIRLSAVEQKTLTYSREGATHATRLLLDGQRVVFKATEALRGPDRDGTERTWKHSALRVSQRIVKTKGERPLQDGADAGLGLKQDTCLVLYDVHNSDSVAHQVGLETTIDTMIAGNDQNPFVVPGKFGMITTLAEFAKPDVPRYLWAFERADPLRSGLRAVVTLRIGGNVSPPDRVGVHVAGDAKLVVRWAPQTVPPDQAARFGYGIGLGIAPESALPLLGAGAAADKTR
jgi:hypothetical protein